MQLHLLQPPSLSFDASPMKAVQILEANWVYGSYFAWVKITEQSVNEPGRQSVFDIIKGLEFLREESARDLLALCMSRGFASIFSCLFSSIRFVIILVDIFLYLLSLFGQRHFSPVYCSNDSRLK